MTASEVAGLVAAALSATAAIAAVAIAWFQLGAMRREQRLSRRPILAVAPVDEPDPLAGRFTVRNIGEGPAMRCSVTLFVMTEGDMAELESLRGTDREWRWQVDLGTLATGEARTLDIEGVPDELDERWGELGPRFPIGFAWIAHFDNVFGEPFVEEGRQRVMARWLLRFEPPVEST